METILVVNAGSSSLKLQVFALGALSAIRFPCCREMSRGHWSARTLHDDALLHEPRSNRTP
jgi:acetate kinase